jgi:Domain of unknown function (DUF6438)/Ankyrin repeats (3 copies)
MPHIIVAFTCLLSGIFLTAQDEQRPPYPSYVYDVAREHEIEPHRRTIPMEGLTPGFNQLRLTLIVSPAGEVVSADASGAPNILEFWPQLQSEARSWKFTPFEKDGKAVTAEIEEYIDLVPPERLPKKHAAAPVVRPTSKVRITLERTGCYGSCPSYIVAIGTDGIVFNGRGFVVAVGSHKDRVDPAEVRQLAKKFAASDFYSMDAVYRVEVTDMPTYSLSIEIDGHKKEVEDYVGEWGGMPAIITELEDEVDTFANTQRWINGNDGLVQALQAEKFNFETLQAQDMVKAAANRGKDGTVREFLEAGVPLDPFPVPQQHERSMTRYLESMGWLTAAGSQPEVLHVLIGAEASKKDQDDKDLALAVAASSGMVEAARALIAYGANPNRDFSNPIAAAPGEQRVHEEDAGGVLFHAAESGKPEMVREILLYHPDLEMRNQEGKTAVFAAGESRYGDEEGARVECVRLLADAGANVNARDNNGNTPLHETFLADVEKELLERGADVNARNKDGETPIFTNVDNEAIPLFIEHGADLTIRNNNGQTVMEAAQEKGPLREEALRRAIQKLSPN